MSKRFLMAAVFMAMPLGAAADESTSALDPTAPAAVMGPNTAGTSVGAAGLGPQTNPGSSGGSNADSTALQPAGTSPVQTNQTGNILGASSSALQAPASPSDTLKVLAGESDGSPVDPNDTDVDYAGWAFFSLLTGFIALAVRTILRDRRRFADRP